LSRQRFLLLGGVDGRPLAELLDGPEAAGHLERFAIALAGLHEVTLAPTLRALVEDRVLRRHDATAEAAVVREAIDRLRAGGLDLEVTRRHEQTALRIIEYLVSGSNDIPSNSDQRNRLIHRDLYPGQVLVADDQNALVDLDEVAIGEPELDLGNFVAHLTLTDLQRRAVVGPSSRLSRAFLGAYEREREIARDRLAVYQAGTLVRLASLDRLAAQGGAALSWSSLARELTASAERAMAAEGFDVGL
jgi:aminoglycoside phosphotransferase (APT) family kinase protein